MATDRQIAANRQNAQKCCGATTPEGRARSSQNAFKTGIDSKSEVMPCENRAEYEELIAGFHARFVPANLEEASLVDALIRFEWLSRRYMAVESAVWSAQNRQADFEAMGKAFIWQSASICRANQRYAANRRGFAATLKQLKAAQADRPAIVEPCPCEASPDQTPDPGEIPPATGVVTEPLNPELVSFLPISKPPVTELGSNLADTSAPRETAEPMRAEPETGGQDPPIAA